MKKSVLILFAAFAFSCNNSQQNSQEENEKKMTKPDIHDITTSEAITYISEFINRHDSIAQFVSGGGAFTDDVLIKAGILTTGHDTNRIAGTMFFESYDLSSSPVKLQLAVRQIHDFDSTDGCSTMYTPAGSTYLFRPDENFVYPDSITDTTTVLRFLTDQRHAVNPLNDSVRYDSLSSTLTSFLALFAENQYPYGLFTEGSVNDILNQTDSSNNKVCTSVRYFFGYNTTAAVNKVRIILIGVNAAGENVLYLKGKQAKIKDRSIPPTPSN